MSARYFAICLSLAIQAFAQSTATIQGTVVDQSGAAVPHAAVTVMNQSTREQRATVTDDTGFYLVPSLPVGAYSVAVKAAGFQPVSAGNLTLEVGRTAQQNFKLAISNATETVEVAAESPVVESGSVSVGTVINQRTVQEIPLNGRHFVDLGVLIPGSVTPPATGYLTAPLRGQGSFAIITAGNREDTVNFMINGINLNDMAQNQITFQPSINTVQEFKVDNSTYSAEYGRNSGAIVNIATRSGTNAVHGEVFEFLRNNDMDARNYFNRKGVLQSPFKRNQFGADVGAPIWKDHTFFYLSYEGLRQRQGLTLNQPVFSDAQRAQAAAIGNPTVQQLLPLIPRANSGSALFVGSATAPVNIDQGTANLSHSFGTKDRLNWYLAYQQDLRQEPTLQGNNIPGFGDTRQSHRQIMTINETHVFRPDVVNELRLGYNRIFITFAPNAALNPADFGMNVGVATAIGLPQITVRDINLNFGGPNNFPQGRGDYTAVLSDSLSYIRNRHSLKFGAEFRRFNGNSFVATPGTLAFNTTADFFNGQAASFTATPTSNPARIFMNALGAFVQDSYKATAHLTFEIGLRYDWIGTPTEAMNRMTVFDPPTSEFLRVSEPFRQNTRNFQPRVGLAWDLAGNGRTVVRTAYAIMADQPVANLVGGLTTNPPFANPVSFNGPGTVTFANAFTAARSAGSLSPFSIDRDFRNSYMQDWNVNLQQQVGGSMALGIAYVGNKGTHLRTVRNLNQFLPGTAVRPFPAISTASAIAPGAALGNISLWESDGNSLYNGVWLTANKRFSRGLQFNASYTWSKSIDYTSYNSANNLYPNNGVTLQDSNNIRGDRGLSDFDVRHRFVFSGIYELPFRGSRAVEGWNFAVINQLQSGNPVNIITTNGAFTGIPDLRPDVLGPVPTGIGSAANGNPQYFPGNLFVAKNGFGNLGRNVIIGPGFEDVDFSLYKNTRIVERATLQIRADVFNILNHPNFAQPNRTVSTAAGNSFGQITATRFPVGDAGSSRQVQLALKLIF